MSLFPLDLKDIDAIGRGRANRAMPQKVRWWMYAGFAAFAVGIIYWVMKGGWIAVGIMFLGAAFVWYSSMLGDKWRKFVIIELKKEWVESERKSAEVAK